MSKARKPIPTFETEAQERAFWETSSRDSSAFVDWSHAQRVTLPKLKPSTKTISLRLPQHLLDAVKAAANARDVPYQSLIKVWLQEKVES
ncbi:MAG: BrnA antitoxin family protein [Betaproteobacteria bacterium]|jgi:predicted DNA binding CopG/RHH family protein